MAKELGCDSLRYLPVEAVANAIGFPTDSLCQACITGNYPTDCGQQLYQVALHPASRGCLRFAAYLRGPELSPDLWYSAR